MQTVDLPRVPGYPFEFTGGPYGQPEVVLDEGRHIIDYGTQFDGYGVVVSSELYLPDWESTQTSTVNVNGMSATLRTAPKQTTPDANGILEGPVVQLTWQQDGMWISVISALGVLDVDAALRLAESMTPGATPAVATDLASVEIPTDWVLDQWVPDSVCAKPKDAPPDEWGVINIGVCITVSTVGNGDVGTRTLDGDPAELNSSQLIVYRADGRKVEIDRYYGSVSLDQVPSLGLTDDLVIAMYRGITFA
jgi:hypothetical protein